jgi:hypothetical protein
MLNYSRIRWQIIKWDWYYMTKSAFPKLKRPIFCNLSGLSVILHYIFSVVAENGRMPFFLTV